MDRLLQLPYIYESTLCVSSYVNFCLDKEVRVDIVHRWMAAEGQERGEDGASDVGSDGSKVLQTGR